jgi:hypothetical protein
MFSYETAGIRADSIGFDYGATNAGYTLQTSPADL